MRAGVAATVAAYTVLGAALVWSRLFHLGHSFWTDEILMVSAFVRPGPGEIFGGPGLSHELIAFLDWGTGEVVGESEIAYRLWSAAPFIAGVLLVTAWLHRRVNPLSAVLFLFLSTVSPLLLDVTRQARGYGLAFAAMALLVVGALEANREKRTWALVAFCVAGTLGTWTLPQFGVAFVATGIVLVAVRALRRRALVGLFVSMAAIAAWYAPHIGAVRSSAEIPDGVQLGVPWVATAPIDQIVLPALLWIDGTVVLSGLVWLPLVILTLLVMAASRLVRERMPALILGTGPVATVLALWIAQAYVIPRYLSYLLVPLFVLLATGAASLLHHVSNRRSALGALVCVVAVVLLGVRFVGTAPDVVAFPREANRDAAAAIGNDDARAEVLAYMRNPQNLAFYLERPVRDLKHTDVAGAVCGRSDAVWFVWQPFALETVDVPCLDRTGVRSFHFRQYARGDEMNVWFVPPA